MRKKPTPDVMVIDRNLDIANRPMVGIDIADFMARHQLKKVDVIYALAFQNSVAYKHAVELTTALPFAVELLIRLYDISPSNAPWRDIPPSDGFDMLYGDIETQFRNTPYAKEAKLALMRRMTALFGRSVYTGYRWIEGNGQAKQQVTKILAKLSEMPMPRATIEMLAKQMHALRGEDFDVLVPLPSLDNPPLPKRRGPPSKAERAARLAGGSLPPVKRAKKVPTPAGEVTAVNALVAAVESAAVKSKPKNPAAAGKVAAAGKASGKGTASGKAAAAPAKTSRRAAAAKT